MSRAIAPRDASGADGTRPEAAQAPSQATLAVTTARTIGLAGCRCCGLVSDADRHAAAADCPRCGATLHTFEPQGVQRTYAYLLAALLLYVPANLLPVMSTVSVLGASDHTIIGGIADLWVSGSWLLAIIVLVASIVVPLLKISALGLLAYTAQRRSTWRQLERARLYRLVETVGDWSMLDVFVVVLLVGMVRFGVLASVRPEAGLLAFGGVVVLTLLAAASFDPKLIWPEPDDHD